MIKTLLLATTNQAKLTELSLGAVNCFDSATQIVNLKQLMIIAKPEETGKTFEENAQLKARFYGELTRLPAIADDGGLMIPYLNNEPGVKSSRWLGREASDQELIEYTLLRLRNATGTDRTAYLQTCLCFFNPENKQLVCETERIKGVIAKKSSHRPTHGYPYRALFIVDAFNKYYDELSEEEHLQINHRLKALRRLIKKFSPDLLQ